MSKATQTLDVEMKVIFPDDSETYVRASISPEMIFNPADRNAYLSGMADRMAQTLVIRARDWSRS